MKIGATGQRLPIGLSENMNEIEIRGKHGELLVVFDGSDWSIYNCGDEDDPSTFCHDLVMDNPFYLFNQIRELDDAETIINELAGRSDGLKDLVSKFRNEEARLRKRLILLDADGSGAVDEFTDQIFVTGKLKTGLQVDATISGDNYGELDVNAYGEIIVESVTGIRNAEELFDAIVSVTSDEYDRWNNIKWKWNTVLENLATRYPKLSVELGIIVGEVQTDREISEHQENM